MSDPLTLPSLLAWTSALPAGMRPPTAPDAVAAWQPMVSAIVGDVVETLTGNPANTRLRVPVANRELQAWILAACHVCWHPAVRTQITAAAGLERLLLQELPALAALVKVSQLDADDERREELVRRCLRALDRHLDGENAAEAEERLRQVDSIERQHLVRMVMERQEKLRRAERLRRKAEEEAASKVSRE